MIFKRDAQEAASANENKPHQKDEKDPDPGGDLSTSPSQPSENDSGIDPAMNNLKI